MKDSEKIIDVWVRCDGGYELFYSLYKQITDNQVLYSIYVGSMQDGKKEEAWLEDVSRDFDKGNEYLYLFASNTVTPETAHIIMEELLSRLEV